MNANTDKIEINRDWYEFTKTALAGTPMTDDNACQWLELRDVDGLLKAGKAVLV